MLEDAVEDAGRCSGGCSLLSDSHPLSVTQNISLLALDNFFFLLFYCEIHRKVQITPTYNFTNNQK